CKNGKCITSDDDDECDNECKTSGRNIGYRKLFTDCVPFWQCGGWSACVDGIKTRNCEDINHCDVAINKPLETMGCESEVLSPVMDGKTDFNWQALIIGIILFLVLLVVLSLLLRG
ncbi:MAG: hypothetical protein ABII01_03085, partial [Candidatus Woesearchaeota archaeon]